MVPESVFSAVRRAVVRQEAAANVLRTDAAEAEVSGLGLLWGSGAGARVVVGGGGGS
jgi:hypothetical protein